MFCSKCGTELSENATLCPGCGETVNSTPEAEAVASEDTKSEVVEDESGEDELKQRKEDDNPKPSKLKSKLKFIIPAVAVVIIIIVLLLVFWLPKHNYNKALDLLSKGAYSSAGKYFEKTVDSNDNSIYYVKLCKKLAENGDDAWEGILDKKGYKDGKYAAGVYYKSSKNYLTAVDYFDAAGKYEDAKSQTTECNYLAGEKILSKKQGSIATGKLNVAYECYKAAGKYKDSKKKMQYCENAYFMAMGNESYDSGELRAARNCYSSVPSNFTWAGVNAGKRLAKLKKYSYFVKLCGTYETNSGYDQIYASSIGSTWHTDGVYDSCTVTCTILDSGAVCVSANATVSGMLTWCITTDYDTANVDIDLSDTVGKKDRSITLTEGYFDNYSGFISGSASMKVSTSSIKLKYEITNSSGEVTSGNAVMSRAQGIDGVMKLSLD